MHSNTIISESGAIRLSDKLWVEARRRAEVISPLAKNENVSVADAVTAAQKLGLSERTVYSLVRRWRSSGESIPSLVSSGSRRDKGKSRLSQNIDLLISTAITDTYLSRQKLSMAVLMMVIKERCHEGKIPPPSINTVKARIKKLRREDVVLAREGPNAVRKLQPIEGHFPESTNPLDVIQMDHTPVDLIIVDSYHRKPIGRPYVTIAIDTYSRCIVGFCLTLEAPSATSVGLCLVHIVTNKQAWLERIGVDVPWPMSGKPKAMYVDNGSDFHSEALKRGCEVHGIQVSYRPVGEPQYGGIVERVIGTLLKMVHSLPGTTFSNIIVRGEYNSEKKAVFTLAELEQWFALAISAYHETLHSSIGEPPIVRWNRAIDSGWIPVYVQNSKEFLIDFLPIVHRCIQRQGFVVDHITYMNTSVNLWITERRSKLKFVIRRDPRDISRIYVLHPEEEHYVEVPYRTMEAPSITLWEHKSAVKNLREEGKKSVNEEAIFKTIGKMRMITEEATKKSKAARRKVARSEHLKNVKKITRILPPTVSELKNLDKVKIIKPFSDIEEW